MKIGIDIGGSHIATGIVKDDGRLVGSEKRDISIYSDTSEETSKSIIINTIEEEIEVLLKKYKYDIEDISKIGIAAPGNPSDGILKNLVNLHIKEYQIGKELKKKYSTKVLIKNDGKCAGLAEKKYGSLKRFKDCIFLCIGTGVGSAVFMDDELLEPTQNPGFEFGHMIIQKNGLTCNCGKRGCFETYASMKRFKNNTIKKLKLNKDITSEEFREYIRANIENEKVLKVVDEYIENVAIGISNIINIFEPEAICFGGSFSYYEEIFNSRLEEKVKEFLLNSNTKVKFVSAKFKNDAGIIGATEI